MNTVDQIYCEAAEVTGKSEAQLRAKALALFATLLHHALKHRDNPIGAAVTIQGSRELVVGPLELKDRSEWHEDDGNAMWFTVPIEEPPYVGTPLDTDWPDYHTHFCALPLPIFPEGRSGDLSERGGA